MDFFYKRNSSIICVIIYLHGVDLDLTDLFFNVYKQQGYFDIESYSPEKFKAHIINSTEEEYREFEERIFNRNYSSPVYGFSNDIIKKL